MIHLERRESPLRERPKRRGGAVKIVIPSEDTKGHI